MTVNRLCEHLDDETAARVFHDNAARLFHFGDEVLTEPL